MDRLVFFDRLNELDIFVLDEKSFSEYLDYLGSLSISLSYLLDFFNHTRLVLDNHRVIFLGFYDSNKLRVIVRQEHYSEENNIYLNNLFIKICQDKFNLVSLLNIELITDYGTMELWDYEGEKYAVLTQDNSVYLPNRLDRVFKKIIDDTEKEIKLMKEKY